MLVCASKNGVCATCYGRDLAQQLHRAGVRAEAAAATDELRKERERADKWETRYDAICGMAKHRWKELKKYEAFPGGPLAAYDSMLHDERERAEAAENRAAALEAALREIEAIAGGLDEEEASFVYTTTYQRALKIARGALADLSGALAQRDAGVRKAALLEAASEADRHYTEGIATWLRELAEKERG